MVETLYGRLVVTDPDVPEGVIKMHPDTAALVLRMHRRFSVPVTIANAAAAHYTPEGLNLTNGGGDK